MLRSRLSTILVGFGQVEVLSRVSVGFVSVSFRKRFFEGVGLSKVQMSDKAQIDVCKRHRCLR